MDRADTVPMEVKDRPRPPEETSTQATTSAEVVREIIPAEIVDVDMRSVEDGGSLGSTNTSIMAIPTKRKFHGKVIESSDAEEEGRRITRSKFRRKESENRTVPGVQSKKKTPVVIRAETESTSYSESEHKANQSKQGGCKDSKRKAGKNKKQEEPVESRLREVPINEDELWAAPASELGASALEWLEDIELLRSKSRNLQGGWSDGSTCGNE